MYQLKQIRTIKHTNTSYKLTFGLLLLLVINPATAEDKPRYTLPSGKLEQSENGDVLTLSSGEKFVSQTITDKDGNTNDTLAFPNGQLFVSETAKGGPHVPYVSADGVVVAIVRCPATKMATLHIYFKDSTGRFKEIENANEQVSRLLTGVKVKWPNYDPPQEAAKYALQLLSMSGHTLTLESVSYRGGHESKTYQFKVTVVPDGSLALAKRK
jgi:hypothetical protein